MSTWPKKKRKKDTMRRKAIKYPIYPNQAQIVYFRKCFGCVRKIWNLMLSAEKKHYKETGKHLVPTPATFKKMPEYSYLKEADSLALANAQINLENAFNAFFEQDGVGHPKYKSKHKSRASYTTNNIKNANNIKVKKNAIKLPKAGWVKAKIYRKPKDNWVLKSATVSEDSVGSFWVSILYEYEPEIQPKINIDDVIGLDYKSDGLCADDNGLVYSHDKFYRQSQKRLAREQRKLSRKQGPNHKKGKKGSNNYEKQRHKVAKLHRKIANQRRDRLHKLSTEIANRYDLVCTETLNMQSIGNKHFHLGKATYDNGYGMFLRMLEYKLKDRGKYLQKIDKWYASSQICSNCGRRHKMPLDVRRYQCECGLDIDRDLNAAINIKREGLRIFLEDNPNITYKGRAGTAQTDTLVETGSAGNQTKSETEYDSSTQSMKQEARLPYLIAEQFTSVASASSLRQNPSLN